MHRWCPCGAKLVRTRPWEGDPAKDWYCPEEDDVLLRHEPRGPVRHFWDVLGREPVTMFLFAGCLCLAWLIAAVYIHWRPW